MGAVPGKSLAMGTPPRVVGRPDNKPSDTKLVRHDISATLDRPTLSSAAENQTDYSPHFTPID